MYCAPPKAGYDALFQDCDPIWYSEPWAHFSPAALDAFVMDDENHSQRFAPFYANSGFFFMRSGPLTRQFWLEMLTGHLRTRMWQSQQTMMNDLLADYVRFGLSVRVFERGPGARFGAGARYKARLENVRDERPPVVWHNNW